MARHEEYRELAALHMLAALEPDEAARFEQHLREGCAECEAELSGMREAVAAVGFTAASEPPPGLRDQLFARIRSGPQVWKGWSESPAGDLHVVRGGEGGWQIVRDGVYAKRLYVDPVRDSVTMLIRMDPGASYVPHRHGGPEQCFVLEGDIHEGNDVFHAGDFQCAAKDSTHGAQWTENGCLLLIVSSLHDQLLT
jgi:hypothetical protein